MKNQFSFLTSVLVIAASVGLARAADAPNPAFADAILLPANPSSADNIRLSIQDRSCSMTSDYTTNRYRVSMVQNNITIRLGDHPTGRIFPLCPPAPREEIDLGKLPAGNYTVTVIEAAIGGYTRGPILNAPFTVADARASKQMPWVSIDYSGMWWDPTDSGSGLFIWQDAIDNTFAAWFTYAADGKPSWYVFQPKWQTASTTFAADLIQTERKPNLTIPPPNPTSNTIAGTASLDFANIGTAEEGKFSVTLKGQALRVINIERFKP